MLSLSVNRWDFTDKLFKMNNLSVRRRSFTDEIHSVRQRLSGIADVPQIMRCVTKNGTSQNWIDSNNLHVVILCIFLSVKKI